MALRPILIAPDPLLKRVSEPVSAVTDDVRRLMDDMLETMYAAPGIGLAAIQIGVAQRVIVIDIGKPKADAGEAEAAGEEGKDKKEEKEPDPKYFVNPEIVWASDDLVVCEEGCLSVPDLYEEVERPAQVRVRYLDYHGRQQEIDCEGMLAVCIQHEMDHLEGVLFIDHLSRLKREMMLKKLAKARKSAERENA
jgi:peptide deformylase